MKKYKVFISPEASEELDSIWLYVFNDSGEVDIAESVITRIVNFCNDKLSFFPEMGTRRDTVKNGVRFFPVDSYGVYYFFDGDTVSVSHVIRHSQDVKNIF